MIVTPKLKGSKAQGSKRIIQNSPDTFWLKIKILYLASDHLKPEINNGLPYVERGPFLSFYFVTKIEYFSLKGTFVPC